MKYYQKYVLMLSCLVFLAGSLCFVGDAISQGTAKRDSAEALVSAIRSSVNDADMNAFVSLFYYKDTSDLIKRSNEKTFKELLGADALDMKIVEFEQEKKEKMNSGHSLDCKDYKPTMPVQGGISITYKKGYNEGTWTLPYGVHEGVYYLNSVSVRPMDEENPTSFTVVASSPNEITGKFTSFNDKPVRVECVFSVSGKDVHEQTEGSSNVTLRKCGQSIRSCEAKLLEPDSRLMLQVYKDGLPVYNSISPDGGNITYSE